MAESSNQRLKAARLSAQVTWSGPNSKKGKKDKGKVTKRVRISDEDVERQNGSDEESDAEGSYYVEESIGKQKIRYERKRRSCSDGGYHTKPAPDAKPTLYLLKTGKGFKQSNPKHLLSYIVKIRFDDKTINTKGAQREAFLDGCIEEFKEYYNYPPGCGPEKGDRAVRTQLKKNWKHIINPEKARLMAHVNELLKAGYSEEQIKITELKPHYFSQRAWNSLCAYWGTPRFETRSKNGKRARKMVEFTSRTGAKPFDLRREEIDAEREAKGEEPIGEDEFLGIVYDPSEPAVKDLQEKMKVLRAAQAELTPELSPGDQPPSPRTQREIRRKKDLEVLIQAKPPNKGIVFLHPRETLPELIGAEEATHWINRETMKNSQARVNVPDEICLRMSMILDEVKQMVQCLPMREVKQSFLDDQVRNLAAAAFSDPSQHALQRYYAQAAKGLLPLVLKENDKIIQEESPEKAMVVDGTKAVMVDGTDNFEDEDPLAHMYPLH